MSYIIIGAVIFAAGVLMGAWIVDRIQHDKPVLPQKTEKHKAKAAVRDEELE
jgi:hypothetical protein